MKRITIISAAIVIILAIPLWSARIHIDISAPGFSKLKIAMPYFTGPSNLASNTWSMIEKDIRISGVFELIDPHTYIHTGPMAEIKPGTLKDWGLIGADFVITGSVERQEDDVRLSTQIIELPTAKVLVHKTYITSGNTMYMAVHKLIDDLLAESFDLQALFSTKIASIVKRGGKKYLYITSPDGTGPRVIKGLGDLVLNPAWSPDGKHIAFVSYKKDNPDLYVLDLEAIKVTPISTYTGINSSPTFHPDGKHIACTLSKDGNPEIYMIDLKNKDTTRLTNNWATDTSPSFSPEGNKMVFCSNRGGSPQIYIKDLKSRKVNRLTFEGNYNTEPVFSPRGDWIAFTHAKNGVFHIAIVRPDGTDMRVLQGTNKGDESPFFSPDGRLLVFGCADGHLYITDLAGNPPVKITIDKGAFSEPCWSVIKKR